MKTKETLGALDIVCNIAGVIYTEDWKKTLDINLVICQSLWIFYIEFCGLIIHYNISKNIFMVL